MRNLISSDSLPHRVKASIPELHLGLSYRFKDPSNLAIPHCFSECVSRQLNQKYISWDSNGYLSGMWCWYLCGKWCFRKQAYPGALQCKPQDIICLFEIFIDVHVRDKQSSIFTSKIFAVNTSLWDKWGIHGFQEEKMTGEPMGWWCLLGSSNFRDIFELCRQ